MNFGMSFNDKFATVVPSIPNQKQKGINEILPLELIQRILLRVPVKHFPRLRCVSKLWQSLISDPHFAELHLQHSPAATNACLYIIHHTHAYFVYLNALVSDDNDALLVKVVSPPFKKNSNPKFDVLGSCRGFVLLYQPPHFLVVWNPLTRSSKRTSYSHIVSRTKYKDDLMFLNLYGFGYDASQDDYLVVMAWQDIDDLDHLDSFSFRTNSWINLDAVLPVLPKHLDFSDYICCGLFLNGAIHWLTNFERPWGHAILVFDLKERTFSKISISDQLNINCTHLGLYEIPSRVFRPLGLSNNGDIIGDQHISSTYVQIRFLKYDVRRKQLHRVHSIRFSLDIINETNAVYTESFLPLPNVIKDKDKKKRRRRKENNGHVLKSVNRILYRMPVQLFAEAIYFDTMAIVDEVSMRQMMQCYQQTRVHVPAMELFVDFDRLSEVEEDPKIDKEKQTVLQENLTDSEDELEATYDVDDEDEDDEEGRAIVALQGSSNQPMNEGVGGVPPFAQAASAPPMNQHPEPILEASRKRSSQVNPLPQ
ncbi:hypothetical protein PIB30_001462 [Stylosanthes scabra]|uniref:F-box domain-containing protein n=1 Tax=Stylosanthes scabra TaxID=79078 RepID=A0ABU6Q3P7_9FABA|nr:hypothetical protein [Stylosanthes scabra]